MKSNHLVLNDVDFCKATNCILVKTVFSVIEVRGQLQGPVIGPPLLLPSLEKKLLLYGREIWALDIPLAFLNNRKTF